MDRKEVEIDKRIALYGHRNDIETTEELIERFYPNISELPEPQARIELQSLIDTERIRVDILFKGNGVYSYNKIIKDFKKIMKNGVGSLSNRLYEFFHLNGTIAHYNIHGWITHYPTMEDIRTMIDKEIYPPHWQTDVIKIVEEMRRLVGLPEKIGTRW